MTRGVDPLTVRQLLRELEALMRDRPAARDWVVRAGFREPRAVLVPGLRESGAGENLPHVALWLEGDGELPPLNELEDEDERAANLAEPGSSLAVHGLSGEAGDG